MVTGAQRGPRARIAALVEPVVAKAGYDLEDITVTQAGRRIVVRVVVDADHGVSLDGIAELSRAVSAALDDVDTDGGLVARTPYTLEVTSPGVDRPLTEPRHWRRNVGRLVSVRVDEQTVTGRVAGVDAVGVTLTLDKGPREVPFDRLGAGKVQVEFGRREPAGSGGDEDEGEDEADGDGVGDAARGDAAAPKSLKGDGA